MHAIELHGVTKSFGGKPVLRGVDLTVPAQGIVGFVGPNGAGKSTCLRILVGLVAPDGGRAAVLGLDPTRDSLRIRGRCSYLPGEASVYPGMRGRDFLDFALGFYPDQDRSLRATLEEAFALPLRRRVRTYSAGMKQKLALLATLAPDVPLYVLDEPDRALDATARFVLRDALRHLRERGKAVFLSSHHLSEVESLADALCFLLDGAVVAADRLRRARDELSRWMRIRLRDPTPSSGPLPPGALPPGALPPGAELVRVEPDGSLLIAVARGEAPLPWLARLPADGVESAEVGIVHLEDLYRLLLLAGDGGGAPA